jgi:hypothetical protein
MIREIEGRSAGAPFWVQKAQARNSAKQKDGQVIENKQKREIAHFAPQ